VAAILAAGFGLLLWSPWDHSLTPDRARAAIARADPAATVQDGPSIDGHALVVHVGDARTGVDMLVVFGRGGGGSFGLLQEAERRAGGRWGQEVGCQSLWIAYRERSRTGHAAYDEAYAVERALDRVTPGGQHCQV